MSDPSTASTRPSPPGAPAAPEHASVAAYVKVAVKEPFKKAEERKAR